MFNKKVNWIIKELILFIIGGLIYFIIENIFRGLGNSHWTMIVVGGLCFVCIGLINELFEWDDVFIIQWLASVSFITTIEFISGYILNILLGLDVWDYSDRIYNVMGQICLQGCCYWVVLSPIGIILDDYIRYYLFKEDKPHYKMF